MNLETVFQSSGPCASLLHVALKLAGNLRSCGVNLLLSVSSAPYYACHFPRVLGRMVFPKLDLLRIDIETRTG